MMNLGDQPAGSIMYVPFATYNAAGASVTITGLAVTDIEIYKNGSTTQRASDNGYTLLDTDGIDFDGITGIHGFSVDLADNTTAGFYAAGSVYWLVVSAITVDSQTVNFVYYFTIDRDNVLRPTTAGRTLDVSTTGEAGLDFTNISNAARRIPELGIADRGTASAATSTTVTLQASHGYSNNTANGKTLVVWGTTAGTEPQSRAVLSSASDVFTLDAALTETPTGTLSYVMFDTAPNGALVTAVATIAKLETMLQLSGAGPNYQFTADAVELAPTGGAVDYTVTGTADSGSTSSMVDNDRTEATGYFDGWKIRFTSGVTGQERTVRAYTNSAGTKTFTWDRLLTAGVTTNTYELRPQGDAVLSPGVHTGAEVPADAIKISGDAGAADNLETMLDGTSGGTLSLKQLNVVNSTGDAIVASSTGSNGNGINASGNGTGAGVLATAGATGHGVSAVGGATSGDGLRAAAATSGAGITASGAGTTKAGIAATGGATTSAGISATGGSTSGDGILTAATSGHGIVAAGSGTTKHGVHATGGATSSHGINAAGGGVGHGINATSGSGATGDGIRATAASTNGHGLNGVGVGTGSGVLATGGATGSGVLATGGATGHGISGVGGATSGNGIRATGTAGNSAAINAVGQGSASGVLATGGATGHGIEGVGGSTSGSGIRAAGTAGNSAAITAAGQGSAAGIQATGGTTGPGVAATGGATSGAGVIATSTSGNGITATAGGGNGSGIAAAGQGSGAGITATAGATGAGVAAAGGATSGAGVSATSTSGNGVTASGGTAGHGIAATGGATGHGVNAVGGATSGNGIRTAGTAGNSAALLAAGQGSAPGISSTGGATGVGIDAVGGATSGAGLVARAQSGNSDGVTATKQGSGLAFNPLTTDIATVAAALVVIDDFLDTEVLAILNALTANRGEPGQGAPGVSISAVEKIDWLYKSFRNRKTQTATEFALYADDGTTKDQEAAVSSDGTTLVFSEMTTGA